MNTVRFAIVGCGRICMSHIKGIADAPSAVLIAVCDIKEEKARKAAEEAGIAAYYTDLEMMLDKEKPDVLCVCVPSGYHAECAILAARKGVHVLCEKPLDVTQEKIDAMIRACDENHVKIGGIFQRRNVSAVQHARQAVAAGRLGKLVMASASLKYFRDQAYYDSGAWRGTKALDGGCLMNQCIHGIDLLQYLAGEITSVFGMCATLAREIEMEDTAACTVRFKNGAMGVIEAASSVSPGQDTMISLHGTEGTIIIGGNGFLQWALADGSEAPSVTDSMGGLNCGWVGHSLHTRQIEDMAKAVLEDRLPMVPGQEARKAVDIIQAIYRSAASGKIERV